MNSLLPTRARCGFLFVDDPSFSLYLYVTLMRRSLFLVLTVLWLLAPTVFAKPDSWVEVRTPHFTVLSNSNDRQARHIADQLERMRSMFHKLFPKTSDPDTPIIVLAVKDKKGFQALEPEEYLAKGQLQLAGLFLRGPEKNYVLLRLDAEGEHPYSTVYHEYTHLLNSRAGGWLPLWMDEGLAQFYENTDIHDKEVILGQPNVSALWRLHQNRLIPLATLFAVDHNSPYYHQEDKGSLFYAESWALTHYLFIKDFKERTNHLGVYADLVGKNIDPVEAAGKAFGDLKKLESDLEHYVSSALSAFRMEGSTDVDESTFKIEPIPTTQADAARADFLVNCQRAKDARALLESVLRDDPKNVSARETLGFMAFREGKLDQAQHWYEEAIKLDSQSYLANYYFAAIAMRDGSRDADRQTRIESSLQAAIKLNPSFSAAYDRLAMFYGMQNKNMDEARRLSIMAVQLDPVNVGYRLNAANLLMMMERPQDAIAVLQNALKLAKTPEESTTIQSRLEGVQQYQASREAMERRNREAKQDSQSSAVKEMASEADSKSMPTLSERHGPRRSVKGMLKDVHCAAPAIIELKIESSGKAMPLWARNYYKIEFGALNYTPQGELHPCSDLEGAKALVEYFEPVEKTDAGQIVSIQLTK